MADFIKIDTQEVTQFLKVGLGDLPKNFRTRKVASEIASFVTARIKVRTLSGVDRDLKPFAPYAPSTKRARAKRGRQVDKVDLYDTGQMQGALGYEVNSDTEATVKFIDAIQQKKAAYHQFGAQIFTRSGSFVRRLDFVKGLSGFGTRKASLVNRSMPARQFFGVGNNDKLTLAGIDKLFVAELDHALGTTKGFKTSGNFIVFTGG